MPLKGELVFNTNLKIKEFKIGISYILYHLILLIILLYKIFLSPFFGNNCRFYPSCSNYSQLAIKRHGIKKGIYLSIIRICKCHPWYKGGYDPVP